MQQISPFIQVASFAGALLILVGYAGEQFGWMSARRPSYNVVNAIGLVILGIIALRPFQLEFAMLEFAWAAISLYALARCLKPKPVA